jgi:hypothetical protein
MKRTSRHALLGILMIGLAIVCVLVTSRRPPSPPLPTPNGYDDFLKAAKTVVAEGRAYRQLEDDEIRNLVKENRSTLELVRHGLKRECRVSIRYERGYLDANMQVLASFKRVVRAFLAEGTLAEREGRTNDAARVYLDGIRFGQECCRGGLVIDRLLGVACEAIDFGPLNNLVQNLDARTCREVAQVLETMEGKREPWEPTVRVERLYFRKVANLRESLIGTVQRMVRWCQSWRRPVHDPKEKLERVQGWERRLILQAAARAYQLEHGKAPERVAELIPDYLKAVPKDPVTGQDLALP